MHYNVNPVMMTSLDARKLYMSPYKKLISFVDEVVDSKAKFEDGFYQLPLHALSQEELSEFAALLAEYQDRDIGDVFAEDEVISSLIMMMAKNTAESHMDFAEATQTSMIKYFEKTMERMLDERCDDKTSVSQWEDRYADD